jgi:hypothetical protein
LDCRPASSAGSSKRCSTGRESKVSLRAEGRDASLAIDALKAERADAASYDKARDLDDRINRQIWICENAARAIPQLELQLGAARAAQQAQALARHKNALLELYPRLKKAIVTAVALQKEAMALRDSACRELGEAVVSRNLPALGYAGFLRNELYEIWQRENDRIIGDLQRKRSRQQYRRRRNADRSGHVDRLYKSTISRLTA